MKVLIIGGSRFVGKRLAQILLDRKFEVTLLNRGSVPAPAGVKEHLIADRKNPEALEAAVRNKKWDLVIDFYCYTGPEAKEACLIFEEKTARYIHISTVSVYQSGADLKEENAGGNEHEYGKKKFEAELEYKKHAKFPVTLVRFPIILGMDDYTKRLYFHVDRIKKGLPIYFPNLGAKMSFISSSDAAKVLNFLIDHPFEGPINCASADPVRIGCVTEWIEQVTGCSPVFATNETETNFSPFGVEEDSWVNTEKLQFLGFKAAETKVWFPELVKQMSDSV